MDTVGVDAKNFAEELISFGFKHDTIIEEIPDFEELITEWIFLENSMIERYIDCRENLGKLLDGIAASLPKNIADTGLPSGLRCHEAEKDETHYYLFTGASDTFGVGVLKINIKLKYNSYNLLFKTAISCGYHEKYLKTLSRKSLVNLVEASLIIV